MKSVIRLCQLFRTSRTWSSKRISFTIILYSFIIIMDCPTSGQRCEFVVSRGITEDTGWLSKCVICRRLFPKDMVKCEICPAYAHRRCILGASRVTVRRDALPVAITAVDAGTQSAGCGDSPKCADDATTTVTVGTQTRWAANVRRAEICDDARRGAGDSVVATAASVVVTAASVVQPWWPKAADGSTAPVAPTSRTQPPAAAAAGVSTKRSRLRPAFSMVSKMFDWISFAK